jgi:hypothetical protein
MGNYYTILTKTKIILPIFGIYFKTQLDINDHTSRSQREHPRP